MIRAVTQGKAGTAMQGFSNILSNKEIDAVVEFVRVSFMQKKLPNTRYHTVENGWENHERYRLAYPFVLGELALDTPLEELSADQQAGMRLYMSACISCHDRAKVNDERVLWQSRPLSFPRAGYSHTMQSDAVTGASPYAVHEQMKDIAGLSDAEKRGESIFKNNCAFCHAQDGTGKNWIGSYLEPHPRNLTDKDYFKTYSIDKLKNVIANGVNGSAMPAWKTVLTEDQLDDVVAYVLKVFL